MGVQALEEAARRIALIADSLMPAQIQPLFGPRNGDIKEAFFFFQVAFFDGPKGREDPVFQAGQEDVVEFQPFGLMDGDDRDFRVLGQHTIQFAVGQGRQLEEFRQSIAGILVRVVGFAGDAVELADVFQTVDVMGCIGCVLMAFVPGLDAAFVHDGGDDYYRPVLVGEAAQSRYVLAERSEEGQIHGHGSAAGCRGRSYLFFDGVAQEAGCGQDVVEGVV